MQPRNNRMYSPEEQEGGTEVKKEEPQQEETKQEESKQEQEEPVEQLFTIHDKQGKPNQLTEQQVLLCAQEGLEVYKKRGEEQAAKASEPKPANEELVALRQEIETFKRDKKADGEKAAILSALEEESQKYDLTKVGPKMKELLHGNTLIAITQNRGQPIAKAYASVIENMKGVLEEMNKAKETNKADNNKVLGALAGGQRTSGGVPLIDTETKFESKDVKSGKSRNALQEILKSHFEQEG